MYGPRSHCHGEGGHRMSYTTHPPIVTGKDGLPHCGWCLSERVLCSFHRNQVREALSNLKSAHLLARAQADLRYVVHNRPKDGVD